MSFSAVVLLQRCSECSEMFDLAVNFSVFSLIFNTHSLMYGRIDDGNFGLACELLCLNISKWCSLQQNGTF